MPNVPKWMADLMVSALQHKMPQFEVAAVFNIGPNVKSILLKGSLNNLEFEPGYAVAIRVGPTAFRNYTPSFVDYKEGIFQLLVHIHGNGPGAQYLDNLKAGESLQVSIPRGKRMYHPALDSYVFFGDETTLGLATMLQLHFREQSKKFRFLLELDKEHAHLPQDLGLTNCDILDKESIGNSLKSPDILGIQQRKLNELPSGGYILAGNAQSIQVIRKQLKSRKIPGKLIITQAYWAEGKEGL